jgi:hypothetical protein
MFGHSGHCQSPSRTPLGGAPARPPPRGFGGGGPTASSMNTVLRARFGVSRMRAIQSLWGLRSGSAIVAFVCLLSQQKRSRDAKGSLRGRLFCGVSSMAHARGKETSSRSARSKHSAAIILAAVKNPCSLKAERGKCRDKLSDRANVTPDAALGGEVVVG